MNMEKRVRDFLEPIVVCAELSTLEQVLGTLKQGKPVAIRWPAWQLLLPGHVVGYPLSRRIIDLPLTKPPIISPDLSVQEALIKLRDEDIPYALVDNGAALLGVISVNRLRKYAENEERDRALEAIKIALREKELFFREAHHRIKNNLQIIASLLSLQASYIPDPLIREMFMDSQDRVRSMALIHEALSQSGDTGEIDFAAYIRELASQLMHIYHGESERIRLQLHLDDLLLDVNKATPCGLVLNELLCNALKHAFPTGRSGEIRIDLKVDAAQQVTLVVSDTGIGLPTELDFLNAETLGLQLISTLTEQLNGTLTLDRDNGTVFTLTFSGGITTG
ncbi:MAG TPA: histidine kinase dimerization/phosphoacceptor domain -containing protein [Gammaproteobacteria bacterium]|nr:histidine kinase dimerization/phosphoacceptor domain -containing protein [Gammaproteobacteria bacterium]